MTNRFRLRFTFWLDMLKEGEAAIADSISKLKEERLFAQTVRDGIKLIMSLRDGKLDVLFEMFPWVRAEFLEYMREVTSEASPPTEQPQAVQQPASQQIEAERAWIEAEQERMEQERAWEQRQLKEVQQALEAEKQAIEQERQRMEAERQQNKSNIEKKLARLEELLLQQGNVPIQSANGSSVGLKGLNSGGVGLKGANSVGLKGQSLGNMASTTLPPPFFDDDDDLPELSFTQNKDSGTNANQNLINGLLGLQG